MNAFLNRLRYALHGWKYFFTHETNGQIQAIVAVMVTAAGFFFNITPHEWLALLLCMAAVLGLEMVNTAVEKMADHLHPERHPQIKIVKDVAAGAVLWAALISVIVGLVVFVPYMREMTGF